MSLQEYHQEAETNEYHHVHVLEEWVKFEDLGGSFSSGILSYRLLSWDTLSVLREYEIEDDQNDFTDNKDEVEGDLSLCSGNFFVLRHLFKDKILFWLK